MGEKEEVRQAAHLGGRSSFDCPGSAKRAMAIEEVSDELAALRQNLLAKGPEHHAHLVHQRRERHKKKTRRESHDGDGVGVGDTVRAGGRRPGKYEGEEDGEEEVADGSDPEIFPSAQAPASEGSEEEEVDKEGKEGEGVAREDSSARNRGRLSDWVGAGKNLIKRNSAKGSVEATGKLGQSDGVPMGGGSPRGSPITRRASISKDDQGSQVGKASRERSSPGGAKGMKSRTMSTKTKFQATFRSRKTRAANEDKDKKVSARTLSQGEHEYRDVLLARAAQILEQVGPSGSKLKAMEDRLKKAKAPAKEALAALRECEKGLASNAEGSSKEVVDKARRGHRSAERVVEMLTDRVNGARTPNQWALHTRNLTSMPRVL